MFSFEVGIRREPVFEACEKFMASLLVAVRLSQETNCQVQLCQEIILNLADAEN